MDGPLAGGFLFSHLIFNIPGGVALFSVLVGIKTKECRCYIFIVFGHNDFFDFTSKFWNTFLSVKIGFAF